MNTGKDYAILITGFLSALMLFLGTLGFSFEWFTAESIDAVGTVIIAAVPLFGAMYAVWKNTYVSRKAQMQKKVLEQRGLK